jgi:uncharacterized membrane protein YkvA (DUF1232 family)
MKLREEWIAGKMRLFERLRGLIKRFVQEIEFYRRVLRHPKTPFISKLLLGLAIAYVLSPIDIIPDFIPGLGHLDDLIVLPLLIGLAVILIPKSVFIDCRQSREL